MEAKKEMLDDLELRSETVQDILSQPPNWMIRWGNTLVCGILLMILTMSWYIKYPEFVPAHIIVTSQNPPEKLEARINSRIEKILVQNQNEVKRNDILMVLQSTADYHHIIRLKKLLDSVSSNQVFSFPISETKGLRFGELQSDYNIFEKALQDERLYAKLQPYAPENIAVNQSLSEYIGRIATLKQQLNLEIAKFDLSKKNFNRSQLLFDQGVISKMDLESEKIKYLQADQNLKAINISLSQMQEGIATLKKTKSGASINAQRDQSNYTSHTQQMFEQLRKSMKQWEQTYLLISTTDGIVSFQQFWGENQFIKTGDLVCSVLPTNKIAVVGRMQVPAMNSGKIVPGEKVLIKLDNYRFQEYGIVEGKVQHISLAPDEKGNYYVDVIFPKGLHTSYNKELSLEKELKGNAEIVTHDLRLIERFFYQIRELLGYQ